MHHGHFASSSVAMVDANGMSCYFKSPVGSHT